MSEALRYPKRRVITVPTPAVAVGWSAQVDDGLLWMVQSIFATFVADANAATRTFNVAMTDGNATIYTTGSITTATAGVTRNICAAPGNTGGSSGGAPVMLPLPSRGLVMLPGWVLSMGATNLQVGDQFSAIRILVDGYPLHPQSGLYPSEGYVIGSEA
jgi:hypothetical protein